MDISVGIFNSLLQYFPKNRVILVQKLWGEKSCQNTFLAILRLKKNQKKKFRWPLSSRGGGKALMAWPLVEDFFCGFPLGKTHIKNVFFLVVGPLRV